MSRKVFVYKENNSYDRDCVFYIEIDRINGELECGHYFPSLDLTGACFSKSLKLADIDFNNITTILTREEFELLNNFNQEIEKLGYGIKEGDERYQKGKELIKEIQPILDKLLSEENKTLFEKVQKEETEYLMNEYNLSIEDIELIFNEYGLDYRDRAIVGNVFESIEEVSREEAEQLGYITNGNDRYFDYELFGEDLLKEEQYLELSDGRIVYLMY